MYIDDTYTSWVSSNTEMATSMYAITPLELVLELPNIVTLGDKRVGGVHLGLSRPPIAKFPDETAGVILHRIARAKGYGHTEMVSCVRMGAE
jgi:hypothetical protein